MSLEFCLDYPQNIQWVNRVMDFMSKKERKGQFRTVFKLPPMEKSVISGKKIHISYFLLH